MASLVILLLLLSQAHSDSDVGPVTPGDDVILPCQAAVPSIRAVEWTRSDLVSPEYVLFYCNGRSDTTHQKPCFGGRVQLLDTGLETRNMSLILRNVSSSDNGTYECRVAPGGSRHKRAIIDTEPISVIRLKIAGPKNGNIMDGNQINQNPVDGQYTRRYAGLGAVFLLVCFTVGFFVGWKSTRRLKSEPSAADKPAIHQLI